MSPPRVRASAARIIPDTEKSVRAFAAGLLYKGDADALSIADCEGRSISYNYSFGTGSINFQSDRLDVASTASRI